MDISRSLQERDLLLVFLKTDTHLSRFEEDPCLLHHTRRISISYILQDQYSPRVPRPVDHIFGGGDFKSFQYILRGTNPSFLWLSCRLLSREIIPSLKHHHLQGAISLLWGARLQSSVYLRGISHAWSHVYVSLLERYLGVLLPSSGCPSFLRTWSLLRTLFLKVLCFSLRSFWGPVSLLKVSANVRSHVSLLQADINLLFLTDVGHLPP